MEQECFSARAVSIGTGNWGQRLSIHLSKSAYGVAESKVVRAEGTKAHAERARATRGVGSQGEGNKEVCVVGQLFTGSEKLGFCSQIQWVAQETGKSCSSGKSQAIWGL